VVLLSTLPALAQPPSDLDDASERLDALWRIAEPRTKAWFERQVARLRSPDRQARLEAIQSIREYSQKAPGTAAIPAVERCLRDPEPEVRAAALNLRGSLAFHAKEDCPLLIVEALLDESDDVRYHAGNWIGAFDRFAPGGVEVLMRAAKSQSIQVRADVMHALGRSAGKDRNVLGLLKQATTDEAFEVRHTAHIALLNARDRLDDYLPFVIAVREEREAVLAGVGPGSERWEKLSAHAQLAVLGSALQLARWSEDRPDELAEILLKLLDDRSPVMRRGSANLVAASVWKVDLTESLSAARPYVESAIVYGPRFDLSGRGGKSGAAQAAAAEKPPQRSKLSLLLEKRDVEDKLRGLRDDDEDAQVRAAAGRALERLAQSKTTQSKNRQP
jgi:hypothetical protein